MTCPHRIISLAENGTHRCRVCGAPVGVLDDRARDYLRAVDALVYAARRFTAVTRRRRKDLYKQAFNALGVAARGLDEWYDEPVLPARRTPDPRAPESRGVPGTPPGGVRRFAA